MRSRLLEYGALTLLLVGLTAGTALGALVDRVEIPEIPQYDLRGREMYVPGQVLVKFEPETKGRLLQQALADMDAKLGLASRGGDYYQVLLPEGMDVRVAVARFEARDDVLYAGPNWYVYAEWDPNDEYYAQGHCWNMAQIDMPDAWDLDTTDPTHGGDPSVVVAVSDTGVAFEDYSDANGTYAEVSDFRNGIWYNNTAEANGTPGVDDDANGYIDDICGWDFLEDDAHPNDREGHGTHVSGTVAQQANNGSGLNGAVGVAFWSTIMPIRIIDAGLRGTTLHVNDAMYYVADMGVDVINMSWGHMGSGHSANPHDNQYQAFQYAADAGVVLISSSGNDADLYPDWKPVDNGTGVPACYPHVICVGGSESRDRRVVYSEYGYGIEILAPGGSIRDSDSSGRPDRVFQQTIQHVAGNDFTNFSIQGFQGTSMASPHVSGLAALLRAQDPTLTYYEIRGRLAASCTDWGDPGYDYENGYGLVNAYRALSEDPDPNPLVRRIFWDDQINGDMRGDPGDTVDVAVELLVEYNNLTNVSAVLSSADANLTVTKAAGTYPDIPVFERDANLGDPFEIEIAQSCPNGHVAAFTLDITCDEVPAGFTVDGTMILGGARILFVEDDRNKGPNNPYDHYVTDALDLTTYDYDVFHTQPGQISMDEVTYLPFETSFENYPTFDDLRSYDIVVWSLSSMRQTANDYNNVYHPLWEEYLQAGGNLLLAGHEYLYKLYGSFGPDNDDYGPTEPGDFPREYFRVDAMEHDDFYYEVDGVPGDSISDGMHFDLTDVVSDDPDGYPTDYDWWPDDVLPMSDAQAILTAGPIECPTGMAPEDCTDETDNDIIPQGACMIRYPADGMASTYKTILATFPLESLAAADLADLLTGCFEWFDTASNPEGVMLTMPDSHFTPGEDCWLRAHVTGPDTGSHPLVIMLDVGVDTYWFWPSWDEYPPAFDYDDVAFPPAVQTIDIIPSFPWPTGVGDGANITFWGALLTADMSAIHGALDYVTFSFGV